MKTSNLDRFRERLLKLGIEIHCIGNIPWVYLTEVNDKPVIDKYKSEHGFILGLYNFRTDDFEFSDLSVIFKQIRKML